MLEPAPYGDRPQVRAPDGFVLGEPVATAFVKALREWDFLIFAVERL